MRHEKNDGDVFLGQHLPEGVELVGRAPVDDEDSLLVEHPQLSSEGGSSLVDGGEEDLPQPMSKDELVDEAFFGVDQDEVFLIVPILKHQGTCGFVPRDDEGLEPRPVKPDAGHERASVGGAGDPNKNTAVFWRLFVWYEDVDALSVGVALGAHLVHVEDEGGVGSLESIGELSLVEPQQLVPLDGDTLGLGRDPRDVGVAVGCHVLPDGMPRDGEVEVVDEELHQDAQRHGAVGLRFFLDEVFDLIENLTDWTWPSRTGEHVVGALLEALLVLRDVRIRHSHRDGDEVLGEFLPLVARRRAITCSFLGSPQKAPFIPTRTARILSRCTSGSCWTDIKAAVLDWAERLLCDGWSSRR